jgi:predicted RNase H-like HicB family nuclease
MRSPFQHRSRAGRGRHGYIIRSVPLQLTAIYQKVREGYIGFVEELPGANTQGDTLDDTRRNLHEAVLLILEANRQSARDFALGPELIREPLTV